MKKSVRFLTRSALIAALYLVLSIAFQAISFGPVQFRISEILVLLPALMVEGIPGLTIGCFLTNFFFSPFGMYDVIFGTVATFLGSVLTFVLRKNLIFASIPPIILNALLVPIVFILGNTGVYYIAALEILLSSFISSMIIGVPVTYMLKKALIQTRIIKPINSKYDTNPYYREERAKKDSEN